MGCFEDLYFDRDLTNYEEWCWNMRAKSISRKKEPAVDLKEAIESATSKSSVNGVVLKPEEVVALLEAAKRDLARQEAERPKQVTIGDLIYLEERRHAAGGCHCDGSMGGLCANRRNIDVLKALSEHVVPWLRQLHNDPNARIAASRGDGFAYGSGLSYAGCEDLLSALGEVP